MDDGVEALRLVQVGEAMADIRWEGAGLAKKFLQVKRVLLG